MSQWLARTLDGITINNDALASVRQDALLRLQETAWPNRKTEAWRYTPLKALESVNFEAPDVDVASVEQLLEEANIEGLNTIDVVFLNGELKSELESLPEGMSLRALHDGADLFNAAKPNRHLFGSINDVLANDGFVIRVEAGAVIDQTFRVINLITEGTESHTRLIVDLGEGSSFSIVEHCIGNSASLNTLFSEYQIQEGAKLTHARLALQEKQAISLGGCHFNLHTRANLVSTLVGFGSQLSRLDVDVRHLGEHAFAKANAIYLLDGKELFDLHTTIEHEVANGTTEENVRGIAAGNARAVFNGRIHIHRDAQKTLAELNNRNLLMSDKAEINTKPELEIYADDVRCAHGATVAEVDKRSLYYLQTRGISREQAQVMLSFGFINELIADVRDELLAEWLSDKLRRRFQAMEVA